MYDYHLHSQFSGDCKEEMENTILHAIQIGGKQLCFTDHLDYDYPTDDIEFDFNAEGFSKTLETLQVKYKDQLTIHKGIELGLQPHLAEKCQSFVEVFKPDFVLCSFHVANRKDLFNGDFYRDILPEKAWDLYFDDVYETLKEFKAYSVVGHLDIPKRYNDAVKQVPLQHYEKDLEKILKLIIKDHRGIEVNMSGLRTDANEALPNDHILKMYYDLGGKIITLGSDAHFKEDIYSHFKTILLKLDEIGFETFTIFEQMKPQHLSIKKVLESI